MRWEDKILKILQGAEVPYHPEHWEMMRSKLKRQDFSNTLKNKFDGSNIVPPAGAWEAFEQKMNQHASSNTFEKAVKEKFEGAELKADTKIWNNISSKISNAHLSPFEKAAKGVFDGAKVAYNHKHWLAFARSYYQKAWGWKAWTGIAACFLGLLGFAGIYYSNLDTNAPVGNDVANEKSTLQSNGQSSSDNGSSVAQASKKASLSNKSLNQAYDIGKEVEHPDYQGVQKQESAIDSEGRVGASKNDQFSGSNNDNDVSVHTAPGMHSNHSNQSLDNSASISSSDVDNSDKRSINEEQDVFANASIIEANIKKELIGFTNLPVPFKDEKFEPLKVKGVDLHLGYLTHLGNHRGPQSIGLFQKNFVQTSFCNDWEKVFLQEEVQQFQFIYPSIYQASYEGTNDKGDLSWGAMFQTQRKKYWAERHIGGQISYKKQIGEGLLSTGLGAQYSYSFIHDESLSLREQAALSSNVTIGELKEEQILADQRLFGQIGVGYYHRYGFLSYDAATTEIWSNDLIEAVHARHRLQAGVNFSLISNLEHSVWLGHKSTFHDTNVQEIGWSTTFKKTIALNLKYQNNNVFVSELIGKYKRLNAFVIWKSSTQKVDQKYTEYSFLDGQVKGGVRWNW